MKQQKSIRRFAILACIVGTSSAIAFSAVAQMQQSPNGTVGPNGAPQPDSIGEPGNPARPSVPNTPTAPNTIEQPGNTVQPGTPVRPDRAVPAMGTPNTSDRYLSELLQEASKTGRFTTLAKAVQAAGLTNSLRSQNGSFTILAPTDDAFASLPQDKLQRLLQPQNRVTSDRLQTGTLRTLGGGVAVRVTPAGVFVNNASVIQPDIRAQNGVIHAVTQVLMPQELRQQILSL
jgi:uncharacterized surface protein with fasciclin (FAS1) repeats